MSFSPQRHFLPLLKGFRDGSAPLLVIAVTGAAIALGISGCEGVMSTSADCPTGTTCGPEAIDKQPGDPNDPTAPPSDGEMPGMGSVPDGAVDNPNNPGEMPGPDEKPRPVANPNQLNSADLFQCADDAERNSSPGRIRRLGQQEWARNLGARLIDPAGLNPLSADPSHHFTTYSSIDSFDAVTLNQYFDFLPWAAEDWQNNKGKPESIECIFEHREAPTEECVETFVAYYLEHHVLFKPPSAVDLEELTTFAKTIFANGENSRDGRPEAIQKVVSAAWLMPDALFRSEMGLGTEVEEGLRRLDAWEIAHALAYSLTDFAPGAPRFTEREDLSTLPGHLIELRQAAANGSIEDTETIRQFVRDLAAGQDPERADLIESTEAERQRRTEHWLAPKIMRFFHEWLDYAEVETVFKERPAATSAYDDARSLRFEYDHLIRSRHGPEAKLAEQLDDMIARIVFDDREVLKELLTSRRFYVASNQSNRNWVIEKSPLIYGVEGVVEDTREDRWRELPAEERAGVLTHPAWLAAHGGNFDNDPSTVHRGKWVREELLCGIVPELPITVDAQLDPATEDLSARERLEAKVYSDQYCMTCHTRMDPFGLPFEIYNHAGYLRVDDHGQEPNGTSTLVMTGDPNLDGVEVTDAIDLTTRLAESPVVKRCFIRQTFRYFMGRPERRADACTLTQMESAYDESNGSFVSMLEALYTSDAFLLRHAPEELPK